MQEYGDYFVREESKHTNKFMLEHRRMRVQDEMREEEEEEK